jgi:uracil-DNA glycosylase
MASGWRLEPSWAAALADELVDPRFAELQAFVTAERAAHTILPPAEQQLAAFDACAFEDVRVVILGQDPYPTPGVAHGLAFSVPHGVALPASLRNIFAELRDDVGPPPAEHGCLDGWARQGVLLLNSVLTVRAGAPASHAGRGWEALTDGAVRALSSRRRGLVFLLWGKAAQRKAELVDVAAHTVLRAAHPSPLSARRGFFGSRHFSRANAALRSSGAAEIEWRLPPAGAPTPASAGTAAAEAPPPPPPAAAATAPAAAPAGQSRGARETPRAAAAAPARWREQLALIEALRRGRDAPVDFLGCATLAERHAPPADFRFQARAVLGR